MAQKDVLKYNNEYVPTINDNSTSQFGEYETYSRTKIDDKIASSAGQAGGFDWSNKKLVFEGESITANNTMGYPARVAERTGGIANIIAIPGVPVMGKYDTQYYDFRRRIANIPADADAILILGDCNSITSQAGQEYSTNIDEWGGRWNLALDAIKKSFPTVPLLLISEYPMKGKANQNKYTANQFRVMAENHGAIFVCLATETPISLIHAYPTWGLTATDGVHCNHEATMVWADVIANKLKTVKPTEWVGTDTLTIDETATVAVGSTTNINYTITGDLSIQWTTSDDSVACVIGGTIYGMSAGTATITARTRNGHTDTCTVTVTAS